MRRTQRRGEVGLFELLFIIVVLTGGLILAGYASSKFGWLGFVGGGILGVIASLGGLLLVLYVWAFSEALCFGGIPYLPTCGNGKCKSGLLSDFGDYEPETDEQFRAYFRCKCGTLYWRNRKEGRVLEVLPDGTMKPFKIWRSFRGWYSDDKPNGS